MWNTMGQDLKMVEGDYGVNLPVTISGVQFGAGDEVKLTIKDAANGNTIIEKTYSNITDNTFMLVFTEAESALLTVGKYVYVMDWYEDGTFMCNIVTSATLRVVDKA